MIPLFAHMTAVLFTNLVYILHWLLAASLLLSQQGTRLRKEGCAPSFRCQSRIVAFSLGS